MPLFEWCQWLQHTRIATAITESEWLFPLIEGSHILALPLSVGMIVIADLRAEVETIPTFRVSVPKVLFRVPGPVEDNLGGVSRDGQRFVLTINVPADKTETPSGGQ